MDKGKLITTLIGAVVMVLGITGVVTTEEGTALSGYSSNIGLGIIGLVEVIRGIIDRKKHPAQVEGAKPEEK